MRNIANSLGLLAVLLSLQTVGMGQQAVRWENTLDGAQRLASQTNRLVLIQFWAPWCGVCKRLEQEVLAQPGVVAELAASYVPVKINADHFPATARQYGVTALPTTVIVSPQGQPLDTLRGWVGPADFAARLHQVAQAANARGGSMVAQIPAAAPAVVQPTTTPSAPPSGPALGGPVQPQQPTTPADVQTTNANATGMSDDRYADFFRRAQETPATPIAQPSSTPAAQPAPAIASTPIAAQPSMTQPAPAMPQPAMAAQPPAIPEMSAPLMARAAPSPVAPAAPYGAPSDQQPPVGSPAYQPNQPPAIAQPSQSPSTIHPPLALDGYCPVVLSEKQQWMPGDRRWGAIHRGRTYLFSGPEQQRQFFADPDRYAPVVSGNDVVLAVEQGQSVPGMRQHGVFFGNRVYLFAGEESLNKFARNPNLYANQALGAVRPGSF